MKDLFLQWMRVPPEPHPPQGSPDSIRIFRAAPNLYYWNLVNWAFLQLAALVGFGFLMFALIRLQSKAPVAVKPFLAAGSYAAVALFVLQLLLTYWVQRLDYEMRWYIVTDRSLRIRAGVWSVQETTMTFANIQKINMTQGPLQKLLGIATVTATSAGGGSVDPAKHPGITAHAARFEGVDNAAEIRDLILNRLRQYRDAGLGDPDDAHALPSSAVAKPTAPNEGAGSTTTAATLEAARELLEETRRLRAAIAADRTL